MSLVNVETGEIVEPLSADDARCLTNRIRLLGGSLADTLDKLSDLIDQARTRSAWLALGYRSWTEYVSAEFADVLPRLDREPRQEFVRELAARGMSVRAIAPLVGVSKSQVAEDVSSSGHLETPQAEVSPSPEAVAAVDSDVERAAPVVRPDPAPRPAVTGIDGKTYPRPTLVRIDHTERAQEAVAEFPDLAYFRDLGDLEHCWRLADTLRSFDEPEQTVRLDTLRRSIELDKQQRSGTYQPSTSATCPACGRTVRN